LITFLQCVPAISISNGKPAMLPPLLFVVTLSMIKDAFEDYKRSLNDKNENETEVECFDSK
jgi:phospholipid-transporting ATPase